MASNIRHFDYFWTDVLFGVWWVLHGECNRHVMISGRADGSDHDLPTRASLVEPLNRKIFSPYRDKGARKKRTQHSLLLIVALHSSTSVKKHNKDIRLPGSNNEAIHTLRPLLLLLHLLRVRRGDRPGRDPHPAGPDAEAQAHLVRT